MSQVSLKLILSSTKIALCQLMRILALLLVSLSAIAQTSSPLAYKLMPESHTTGNCPKTIFLFQEESKTTIRTPRTFFLGTKELTGAVATAIAKTDLQVSGEGFHNCKFTQTTLEETAASICYVYGLTTMKHSNCQTGYACMGRGYYGCVIL